MSLQLIVYPQNYEGQVNSISSSSENDIVVDGINWSQINASSSYDSPAQIVPTSGNWNDILTNAPPTILNTWYRARTVGLTASDPALPTEVSNDLVLNMEGNQSFCGVYQKVAPLINGQVYVFDLKIETLTTTAGRLYVAGLNSTTGQFVNGNYGPSNVAWGTIASFVAAPGVDTIAVYLIATGSTANESVTIRNFSCVPLGQTPSQTITFIGDGQVICDLYEDEDIPLTLSIDNFKNIAEKVQSYSKAFKLPGTKRNNKIFGNIYEITRADDGIVFNPYVKTKCILKQDGFILFDGYLRLIEVQEKEEEISYSVNLYSEVIALADLLKGRTFDDLDFEELEHEYNKTNIKDSWTGSLTYTNVAASNSFRSAETLKYPFVDWNHQMIVADGFTGSGANLDNPELTFLEQAFRPFIQIKYLIDRIFNQPNFPFSYSSDFFNTDVDFEKLYIDFNWGSDTTGAAPLRDNFVKRISNTSLLSLIPMSYSKIFLPLPSAAPSGVADLWDNTEYRFVSDVNNLEVNGGFRIQLENTSLTTAYNVTMRLVKCNAGGTALETLQAETVQIAASGNGATSGSYNTTLNSGEYLQCQARVYSAAATSKIRQAFGVGATTSYLNVYYSNNPSLVVPLLTKLRGDIDQWQFLRSLITMFNLVTIPDKSNPNNIIIEPYDDVFIKNTNSGTATDLTLASRSIVHDWTDKIDVSEIKLTPLSELNRRTIFKFVEDDDDYIFNVYKKACLGPIQLGVASEGHLYGSLIFDSSTSAQGLETILTGEKEIIPEPFAATVIKPLMTAFPELITPAIYSYNPDDGTSEGFDNAPRIMYNMGVKTMPSTTYWIPDQNGVTGENTSDFLQFSHLTDIPTVTSSPPVVTDTRDFHFGACQLINPIGNAVNNNLFNLYWLPYFAELYNPNTRTMSLKVNLSPGDINELQLYDTVFIKNRQFRINKIEYKPNDLATVEFILIP